MILIGFIGAAGSGKDEAGKIAKEYGFIKKCFSETLKKQLIKEFLIPYKINYKNKNLYGSQEDKEEYLKQKFTQFTYPEWYDSFYQEHCYESAIYWSFNMRSLMQFFGTEVYRNLYGKNYWINKTFDNLDSDGLYYNSSVRFVNEANAIKNLNGYLIKIIRSNAPKISNMSHSSEAESNLIENVDYVIYNDGTLDEFHDACRKIIKNILEETNVSEISMNYDERLKQYTISNEDGILAYGGTMEEALNNYRIIACKCENEINTIE